MGAFQATSSTMKCCDGNCVRRWPLTSFGSYRPGPYPHKGKGVCVRDVCAIYDNNISPSLLMIMIKIIILYFIQIRHTDDFSPNGYPASTSNSSTTIYSECIHYSTVNVHSNVYVINTSNSSTIICLPPFQFSSGICRFKILIGGIVPMVGSQ